MARLPDGWIFIPRLEGTTVNVIKKPLVICKHCTSWEADWKPNYAKDDEHFCPMVSFVTSGDWFCAYGEQKEDDHAT